jgi:uncharacterized membrane protein
VTALIAWNIADFLYQKFQGVLKPQIIQIGNNWPILSRFLTNDIVASVAVVILSLFIIGGVVYAAGLISTVYLVKRMIALGEAIIHRIPVVNFFYGVLKQIMDTVAVQQEAKSKSQRVVLIQYPKEGIYVVGFVTGETVVASNGTRYANVFVPTTPNPTSGFLLLAPEAEIQDTNLSLETGVKFIVSGGILVPENLHARPYNFANDGTFAEQAVIHEPGPEEILQAELAKQDAKRAQEEANEADEEADELISKKAATAAAARVAATPPVQKGKVPAAAGKNRGKKTPRAKK